MTTLTSLFIKDSIRKHLIIAISFLTLTCCSSPTGKGKFSNQEVTIVLAGEEQKITEKLNRNELEEVVDIESLKGTIWIRRPFNDFPSCVDTLNFTNDTAGYEYRCEFESTNKFDYFFYGDTLEIHEYGHISEIHNLGLEVKHRWQYILTNNKLNLTGYIDGTEFPIEPTSIDVSYKLLNFEE